MALQKEKLLDTKLITETSMSTGEVITYEKNIYDEQIHRENIKHILNEKEIHQYINQQIGNFFFCFYKTLDNLNIDDQYKVRFIYLSSFLDYNNEELIDKSTGKKVKLDYYNLMSYLKLSKREFLYTLKELVSNKLMFEQDGFYILNTKYCIKGNNKNITNDCARIFIDSIRSLYLNTLPRNHKQLYRFFKLLPYVNKQHNIITENVDEEVFEYIKPMSMRDICNKLGVTEHQYSRTFKSLSNFMIGDEYVISQHKVSNIETYCINPKLYYMGSEKDSLDFLIKLFSSARVNSCPHNIHCVG